MNNRDPDLDDVDNFGDDFEDWGDEEDGDDDDWEDFGEQDEP